MNSLISSWRKIIALSAFFIGASLAASEWMWHGSFPWIYSHDQKEWVYWRTGVDGRFYQWSQSAGGWEIFNDGAAEWQSLQAPVVNDSQWQAWEESASAFGGDFTLEKIKSAIQNSQSYLDLSYQRISDLSPLREATHLRKLFLQANNISDLSPLETLKNLEVLHLSSNQIVDLSPLANLLELKELYLDDNPLNGLTVLENLGRLEILNLADSGISSLENLAGLTLLEELILRGNQILDVQALSALKKLRTLDLGNNKIQDFAPLGNMSQLSVLYGEDNNLSEISVISNLPSLKEITLSNNQITNLGDFSSIKEGASYLWLADFSRNQLSSLSGMEKLENIRILSLSQNAISDLSPLTSMQELSTLLIDFNEVSTLGPLVGLPKLRGVYANNNLLAEDTSMDQLNQLVELYLFDNNISASRITEIEAALPKVNLQF